MPSAILPSGFLHQSSQPVEPLLDNAGAAAYLGIDPGTLAIWRSTRRYAIPYIKVGRLVRYRASDLDAFLVSRTVAA